MSSPRHSNPRPILKSPSATPPSKSPQPHHAVQFSPCLSTTYLTHASTYYNRSPIQVGVNRCALPQRGCPSQTRNQAQWHIDLDYDVGSSDDDGESSCSDSDPPTPDSSSTFNFPTTHLSTFHPPSEPDCTYKISYSIPHSSNSPAWDCLGGF